MPVYDVVSDDARTLHLMQQDELLGTMQYKTWELLKAVITLPGSTDFTIDKKGFWDSSMEIKQGGNIVLHYEFKWNMEVIINVELAGGSRLLVFKKAGVFASEYSLLDETGKELLQLTPDFKWRKMNYSYRITTTDDFDGLAHNYLLLLVVVHCLRYLAAMATVVI